MTRPLPEALKAPINSLAEAKAWVRGLIAADMLYHFEDSPESIVEGKTSQRLFSKADAKIVRRRVAELYVFEWGPQEGMGYYYCPIGFALTCEPFNEANQAKGFETGAELIYEAEDGIIIDRAHCATYEYGSPGRFELFRAGKSVGRYDTREMAEDGMREMSEAAYAAKKESGNG